MGDQAEAHLGAADCLRLQGSFTASKRHYRTAEILFQKFSSPRCVDAAAGWALSARASGDPGKAVKLLRETLAFYRKDGDREGQAFALWALGGALRIAGDMPEGKKSLLKALALYRRLGDREGEAYTHCALGGLNRMLGRPRETASHYRAANLLHRSRRDTFGTAYSFCGLGNVERMAGRWDAALRFFRRAERLYRIIGDRVSYAYTLWSIGTDLKMKGDFPGAGGYFKKADALFQKTGDARGRAYVFLGYAELKWLEGRDGSGDLRKAGAFAKAGGYAWEALHAKVLKGGRVSPRARALYRSAGSSFVPAKLPVNWP